MSRIVLTDGSGRWFESEKAQHWKEDARFNGSNYVSLATGSQWAHEALYRTASGRYILNHWSQWQGSSETYEEISAADAARWLSQNEYLDGDAEEAGLEEQYAQLEIA